MGFPQRGTHVHKQNSKLTVRPQGLKLAPSEDYHNFQDRTDEDGNAPESLKNTSGRGTDIRLVASAEVSASRSKVAPGY